MYNKRKQKKREYGETVVDEEPKTLLERQRRHQERHPNDKNIRKEDKGVTWSKETERDKRLKQFYKTHTTVWISETARGWIALPLEEEE